MQLDAPANICSMGKVQPYLHTVFPLPSRAAAGWAVNNTLPGTSQRAPPPRGSADGQDAPKVNGAGTPAASQPQAALFITTYTEFTASLIRIN